MIEAFVSAFSTVAVAEMGDRTQFLTLALAARYRKPWSVLAGVLIGSLANHAIAGAIGVRLAGLLTPTRLNLIVGISMIAMALWALRMEPEEATDEPQPGANALLATALAFFLAELGDKTQVATVALAAAYHNFTIVVLGTTLGMFVANAPAVVIGSTFAHRLPMRALHLVASLIFLVIGALFVWRALHPA